MSSHLVLSSRNVPGPLRLSSQMRRRVHRLPRTSRSTMTGRPVVDPRTCCPGSFAMIDLCVDVTYYVANNIATQTVAKITWRTLSFPLSLLSHQTSRTPCRAIRRWMGTSFRCSERSQTAFGSCEKVFQTSWTREVRWICVLVRSSYFGRPLTETANTNGECTLLCLLMPRS